MGKKFDISKLTQAKWVPVVVAAGTAVAAFIGSLSEHKKEKEFESFAKRLSELEKQFKND